MHGMTCCSGCCGGGAADAHGSAKVPMWSAPGSPSTWKEEHVSCWCTFPSVDDGSVHVLL